MSAYEIIRSSFRFPRANASLTREQALLWVRDCGWMGLDISPCFIDLQHLEQEGVVPPNLSIFGKKICIYGHTAAMSSKKNIDSCSSSRFAVFHLSSKVIGVTVADWSFSDQSKELGPCARDCEF